MAVLDPDRHTGPVAEIRKHKSGVLLRPAALVVDASLFTDLPGQAGIFAAEIVGRDDPVWTFGPDAVAGTLKVTDTVFENTPRGLLAGDLSDVTVTVARSDSGTRSSVSTCGRTFNGPMAA